jgi:hypothetical protein
MNPSKFKKRKVFKILKFKFSELPGENKENIVIKKKKVNLEQPKPITNKKQPLAGISLNKS